LPRSFLRVPPIRYDFPHRSQARIVDLVYSLSVFDASPVTSIGMRYGASPVTSIGMRYGASPFYFFFISEISADEETKQI